MNDLNYTNQVPEVDEFIELRVSAGLSKNDRDAATRGLGGTCFSVCARDHAPKTAYVSLFADGGASRLYEKFGFGATAPASVGMALRL